MARHFGKILIGGCYALALYATSRHDFFVKGHLAEGSSSAFPQIGTFTPQPHLPTRDMQRRALQSGEEYDILVIGGGATGAGVALDSTSRGLKTALVERDDFSSGTSSRSTKLVHGGVRYLQKAILQLDIEQYRTVKEGLRERSNLLKIAPHLVHPLPILLPIHRWWQVPYYWIGIKAYDFIAGRQLMHRSYYVSRERALALFPTLKKENLVGALVYYDGQFDDARMNLSIVITAARMGANVSNHVAVTGLLKRRDAGGKERVCGAKVKDMLTGGEWEVRAKSVINATGPFADSVRRMDDAECRPICVTSAGVHIALPDYYGPKDMGLLDPATRDGRVVFLLPWQNATLAGSTDRACAVTDSPTPTEDEILFILNELKNYLSPEIAVRRWDVKSAWCGIRSLVADHSKDTTESVARSHVVCVSDSNLITIAGGKWTTYRVMAKEAVDAAVETCGLEPESECRTDDLLLEGAKGWTPNMYTRLAQYYGFDSQVARHLADTYGDRAFAVAKRASVACGNRPRVGRRLHEQFPYIEAEVRYAVTEYACTAVDVIARRLRAAFLNADAAAEMVPSVVALMAEQLKWDEARQTEERRKALEFVSAEMRGDFNGRSGFVPRVFSQEEIDSLTEHFHAVYKARGGEVAYGDLKGAIESVYGETVDDGILRVVLEELDASEPYRFRDYLQVLIFLKTDVFWIYQLVKDDRDPSSDCC